MFGTFRLVLALMVVWHHLVDREMAGWIAVFGFYCLSGYLMTRIVNETYNTGISGFARYLTNRLLRIYPTYLVVLALTMAAIALWPAGAGARYPDMMFTTATILTNISILGFDGKTPMFIGTAWSLPAEIIHYVAIGALLGRSKLATALWFLFGAQIVIFGLAWGLPPSWFYFSPVGSTVAFATGAMIWHFRDKLPRTRADVGFAAIAAVLLLGTLMPRDIGMRIGGLYIGLLMAAACVTYLRDLPGTPLDRRLGEFSYPLFLIHMPVDMIVRGITDDDGLHMILVSLPITFALSWLAVVLIERPVEHLRSSLRATGRRTELALTDHPRMIDKNVGAGLLDQGAPVSDFTQLADKWRIENQ